MANTSADPSSSARSASVTHPRNRTGAPQWRASRSSRARSRPVPAMARTRSGRSRARSDAAAISTSMPLRGTSRLSDTMSSASSGRLEPGPGGAALGGRQRPEGGGVHAGRDDHHGDPGSHPRRLPRRVRAGGDDARRPPQHGRQERAADGEAGGHGQLGPVDDHGVGDPEAGPEHPEGQGRVEDDEVGTGRGRRPADPAGRRRGGQQHRQRGPLDGERLVTVEGVGVGVGRGEDADALRRQPPPQLPEVGLDASRLGREVVGDQQRGHRRFGPRLSWGGSDASGGGNGARRCPTAAARGHHPTTCASAVRPAVASRPPARPRSSAATRTPSSRRRLPASPQAASSSSSSSYASLRLFTRAGPVGAGRGVNGLTVGGGGAYVVVLDDRRRSIGGEDAEAPRRLLVGEGQRAGRAARSSVPAGAPVADEALGGGGRLTAGRLGSVGPAAAGDSSDRSSAGRSLWLALGGAGVAVAGAWSFRGGGRPRLLAGPLAERGRRGRLPAAELGRPEAATSRPSPPAPGWRPPGRW